MNDTGGTPLHWKIKSRNDVLEFISRGFDVNANDIFGSSALHYAADRNDIECMITLLVNGAYVDTINNFGDSPLHMTIKNKRSLRVIQCLIIFGANFNQLNGQNETPLHTIGNRIKMTNAKNNNNNNTENSYDENVLFLLHSVGAKRCAIETKKCFDGCNYFGDYIGSTDFSLENPTNSHELILSQNVRTIINSVFKIGKGVAAISNIFSLTKKPSLNMPIDQHPSCLDIENEEYIQNMLDKLLNLCTQKEINQYENDNVVDQPIPERLLCLDGGGIRGLILIQMLIEIQNIAEVSIDKLFDWIAGTSTGGLLALAIGIGKTLIECRSIYFSLKNEIFRGSRPYSSESMEMILKNIFGDNTSMADLKPNPKLIITSVIADRTPTKLHLFRNYISPNDKFLPNAKCQTPPLNEQLVWKVARATSAAPTYFHSFESFLDGGLFANNPTIDAMTEIYEYNMAMYSAGYRCKMGSTIQCVVSLGTGHLTATKTDLIDFQYSISKYPEELQNTAMGLYKTASMVLSQACESNNHIVSRARAWCSSIGAPYFRLNPNLGVEVELDETDDTTLVDIMFKTKVYMNQNKLKIAEIVNYLMKK